MADTDDKAPEAGSHDSRGTLEHETQAMTDTGTAPEEQATTDDQPVSTQPAPSAPKAQETPAIKALVSDFPKFLAGIGAFIAAITALITALNGATWLQKETPTLVPTATMTLTATPMPSATLTLTSTPQPTVTSSPTVTEVPPTAVPTEVVSYLLDDFSSGGWEIINDEDWATAYVDGAYQVTLWRPQTDVWAEPIRDYTFGDFRIEVDVRQIRGGVDAYSGVIVRYDGIGFYLFAIADDSMYTVQHFNGESFVSIAQWVTSEAIYANGLTNRITVECLGEHMHFSVNGQPLVEVIDDTHSEGSIGLLVGTFDQDLIETQFDNLRLQVIDRF